MILLNIFLFWPFLPTMYTQTKTTNLTGKENLDVSRDFHNRNGSHNAGG